jgi:hypothetical protein
MRLCEVSLNDRQHHFVFEDAADLEGDLEDDLKALSGGFSGANRGFWGEGSSSKLTSRL